MELQIKRIMQEKGLTNKNLGELLNASPQYAGQIATGKNGATIAQYERIAEILGVKLWQLFAPKEDYVLRADHEQAISKALGEREVRERPDLILIDRETGKTRNYQLQEPRV